MTTYSRRPLDELAQGDAPALDRLLASQLPLLRAWVRLRMGPMLVAREAPSDIVQSACREVLCDISRQHFESDGHFRRCLFQAAGRKLIDRARFHGADKRDVGRQVSPADEDLDPMLIQAYSSVCSPSKVAEGRELLERIELAFARLTDPEREIIAMAKLEGLTGAEIASHLGISQGAVRMALYRALGRLAAVMEGEAGDDREATTGNASAH